MHYKYLGVIFQSNARWDQHFDYIKERVRKKCIMISRLVHFAAPPSALAIRTIVCSLVHPVISYGFPVIHFTQSQCNVLNSLVCVPLRRCLALNSHISQVAVFLYHKVHDVQGLWNKRAFSFAHRIRRCSPSILSYVATANYNNKFVDRRRDPPKYCTAWPLLIPDLEEQYGLDIEAHFTNQNLKVKALSNSLQRFLDRKPVAPIFSDHSDFDLTPSLPSSFYHDSVVLFSIRSRLALNSSLLAFSLHQRHLIPSPNCDRCINSVDDLHHRLFDCPRYSLPRADFAARLFMSSCSSFTCRFKAKLVDACYGIHTKKLIRRVRKALNDFLLRINCFKKL